VTKRTLRLVSNGRSVYEGARLQPIGAFCPSNVPIAFLQVYGLRLAKVMRGLLFNQNHANHIMYRFISNQQYKIDDTNSTAASY